MSLYVDVVGHGYPLVLMPGGPSADLWTLSSFRQHADQFTLVFYDHRCNGTFGRAPRLFHDLGEPDGRRRRAARAARVRAVDGARPLVRWSRRIEYALRYPDRVSHLVLLDTGGDSHWARQNAADLLAKRGYSPRKTELVRRWFTGEFTPREYVGIFMRIGDAYCYGASWPLLIGAGIHGGWRSRIRPEAMIFAGRRLLREWTVMDRLGEISAPTLVMAGRKDLCVPTGLSVRVGGWNPQGAFGDQARGSQSSRRTADRRGHAGRRAFVAGGLLLEVATGTPRST